MTSISNPTLANLFEQGEKFKKYNRHTKLTTNSTKKGTARFLYILETPNDQGQKEQLLAQVMTTTHKSKMNREIEILLRLRGCPFVPQLMGISLGFSRGVCLTDVTQTGAQTLPISPAAFEYTLYTTYVGTPISAARWKHKSTQSRIHKLVKELRDRWGVHRSWFGAKIPHWETVLQNPEGRVFLYNFSNHWTLHRMRQPPAKRQGKDATDKTVSS